jgi:hypothetical protein
MINPLVKIRQDGKVIYSGAVTTEIAAQRADPNCHKCGGSGVIHYKDAGTCRETDAACGCVLKNFRFLSGN